MSSALDEYRKRRMKAGLQPEDDRLHDAALVGAGTTGTLAGAHSIRHGVQDALENAAVPKTNRWKDFIGKLTPGDIVFYREFGKKDVEGFKPHVYDTLTAAKGDTFVHPSVYRGGGMVAEAGGGDVPAKARARLAAAHYPVEARVYRPKNLTAAERDAAFRYLDAMAGTQYRDRPDLAKHGIGHLLGITEATSCRPDRKGGVVCSELVANAYPKRFKDAWMSPLDMRHRADMELVARYGHSVGVPLKQQVLARGVYPLLKNLKWGLGAGLAAYAAHPLFSEEKSDAVRA